jgi:MarR family transcriptional regulator, organic hydroperoxide resistance regulator
MELLMLASKIRFYSQLQKAAHAVKRSADRELMKAAGISTAQSAVLVTIKSTKNITQRELATALDLNEAAVTPMINRLMKLGYVTRAKNPEDQRAWILQLTQEGRRVQKLSGDAFKHINEKIERAVGLNQLEDMADNLIAIGREFNKKP